MHSWCKCLAPHNVPCAELACRLVWIDCKADVRRVANARCCDIELAVGEARLAQVDTDVTDNVNYKFRFMIVYSSQL